MSSARRLYLFVHVPKTAGTSFRQGLESVYPGQIAYDYALESTVTSCAVKRHVYGEDVDLQALRSQLTREGKHVVGGHVRYKRYREIFEPEDVLTFLREPIARVVSEYEHARRHNGFDGSLLEFASRPRNKSLQTRMLRGAPLRRVAFLGITERYNESLRLLEHRLGWEVPALVRNVNPRHGRVGRAYDLTPEEERKLRELNDADLKLYARACHFFSKQLAGCG